MKIAQLLPVAIKVDKSRLPPQLLDELKACKARRPGRFFLELAYCWTVVFGVIGAAVLIESLVIDILAILVVATRQNVLALLVHEQTHCTGLKAYPGDIVTNLLAGYPLLLLTVEGYAQVHLAHHGKYFTQDDPDYRRKSGPEWNYPMTPGKFLKILLGDVLALNVVKLVRGKKPSATQEGFARRDTMPRWLRPLYFVVLAIILSVAEIWGVFFLYWVLPLLTITQLIIRWGAVCEHQYNRLGASIQETTPLIVLKWWEKLLLPNLNFTYHLYHHYFPGVSFGQLPKVHEAFVRHGLVDDKAVFHGYWSYLKFLLSDEVPRQVSARYAR